MIISAAGKVCGRIEVPNRYKETLWWNEDLLYGKSEEAYI